MAKKLKLMEILTDVEIANLKEVAILSISDDPNKDDEIGYINWDRFIGYYPDPFASGEHDKFGSGEAFVMNIASLCKAGRMSQYLTGSDGKTMTYSVFDAEGRQDHNPLMSNDVVPETVKDANGRPQSKHAYFINPRDAEDYARALVAMQKDNPRSLNMGYKVVPNSLEAKTNEGK